MKQVINKLNNSAPQKCYLSSSMVCHVIRMNANKNESKSKCELCNSEHVSKIFEMPVIFKKSKDL